MKKRSPIRGFVVSIFTCLAVLLSTFIFAACTSDYDFEEPETPETPGEEKIDVVLTLNHDWSYNSEEGTAVDAQTANGSIYKTVAGNKQHVEDISQPIPVNLKWTPLEKNKRSTPYFQIDGLGHSHGEAKEVSQEKVGNITMKTYEQQFKVELVGKTIDIDVSYYIPTYMGYEMVYTVPDSIKLTNQTVTQPEAKTRATVVVDEEFRNDLEMTLYRTQYPLKKVIEDKFIIPAELICPVEKEDIPDGGKIVEGSEKFYPHPTKPDTYVSELDAIIYWSITGQKEQHFYVEYDVKQSISKEQKMTVPTIEIGYPKIEATNVVTSDEYEKEAFKDYKFTKTETEWTNTWSNGFKDKINSSYEKADAYLEGVKLFEMPWGLHEFSYNKTDILSEKEVTEDQIVYTDYNTKLNFFGKFGRKDYDKYACDLAAEQEFRVKKGDEPQPGNDELVSWKVDKHLNDEGTLSTLTFHLVYSESGPRDSVATQELEHWTKTSEKRRFIKSSHGLTLLNAAEPKVLSTESYENEKGHHITTIEREHNFTYSQDITDQVISGYQEVYTMFRGEKVEFLTSKPVISASGISETDKGEVEDGGEKYNRKNYVLKYKENYSKKVNALSAEVDIDVKKTAVPEELISYTYDRKFNVNTGVSQIIFHLKYKLQGDIDSIASQKLAHKVTIHGNQHFYSDQKLALSDAKDPVRKSETRTENGNTVTKHTDTYSFGYNLFTGANVEEYETAYTTFRGEKIEFISPVPVMSHVGIDAKDGGVVKEGNVEYDRTIYTVKYKDLYYEVSTPYSATVNVDKKREAVTRTFWEARDKKRVYYDEKHQKVSFTLYEEFSDGSKKNTNYEKIVDAFGEAQTRQTVKLSSEKLEFQSLTAKTAAQNTSQDGNWHLTTVKTPYVDAYQGLTANFWFTATAATYQDGEVKVEFEAPTSTYANAGFTNPWLSKITENGKDYNRYDCDINIKITNLGHDYSLTHEAYVDVLIPEVTRTKWEAQNKKREYYNERQQKVSFTLHEEFSDGTTKDTPIEKLVDAFGEAQPRQTVTLSSQNLVFQSLSDKTPSRSSRQEGNWALTVYKTPYVDAYQGLTANFWFTTTAAVYKDGDIVVDFEAPQSTYSNAGFTNPWYQEISKGNEKYNRYDCDINININNLGHTYNLTHEAYVDVYITPTPDINDPVDWNKTQAYGGISWSFDNNMNPVLQATVITTNNKIIVFNSGNHYDYSFDTNSISGRLGAIPVGSGWVPSYINVKKNPNIFWEYAGLNGSTYNMNGVDILKNVNVELERPFLANGTEYQFNEKTGRMIIKHTYTDRSDKQVTVTLFDGYFAVN